jgi:hypothetical protein
MTEEKPACDNPRCFCCGAGPHVTAFAERLWSKATEDHFRASRLEFLKGLRSLIDDRIEKMTQPPPSKGASVPVE